MLVGTSQKYLTIWAWVVAGGGAWRLGRRDGRGGGGGGGRVRVRYRGKYFPIRALIETSRDNVNAVLFLGGGRGAEGGG